MPQFDPINITRNHPRTKTNCIVMGSGMTEPIGSKKANEQRRENQNRTGTIDEMNSSGEDFSYQTFFDVIERKTFLANLG